MVKWIFFFLIFFSFFFLNTKHLYNIYTILDQRIWRELFFYFVFDVGLILYKCNKNVLCLLGIDPPFSSVTRMTLCVATKPYKIGHSLSWRFLQKGNTYGILI